MKQYAITVNGVTYDVTVEEVGAAGAAQTQAPVQPKAPAVPKAPKAPAAPQAAGGKKVEAGAAGKVLKINANPGDTVKKGDTIIILEIMKMETPIVTTVDGTVASINVNVGDMIEAGAVIATIN